MCSLVVCVTALPLFVRLFLAIVRRPSAECACLSRANLLATLLLRAPTNPTKLLHHPGYSGPTSSRQQFGNSNVPAAASSAEPYNASRRGTSVYLHVYTCKMYLRDLTIHLAPERNVAQCYTKCEL